MSASLIARRLANHGLTRPRFSTATEVVSWYGGYRRFTGADEPAAARVV